MNKTFFKKTIGSLIAIVSFSLFLTIQASAATMEYEGNNVVLFN